MDNKYEAYRCLQCGIMNVLHNGEGRRCRKLRTVTDSNGDVVVEFIDKRFNDVN